LHVATVTGADGLIGPAKIDQGYGQLVGAKIAGGEFREGRCDRLVNQFLEPVRGLEWFGGENWCADEGSAENGEPWPKPADGIVLVIGHS